MERRVPTAAVVSTFAVAINVIGIQSRCFTATAAGINVSRFFTATAAGTNVSSS